MTSEEIRNSFLKFFESKGHERVDSAPMVIKNDPTLMFTNAGMNQFKDIFLGVNEATTKRVVNSQKCLRVSGKHNDLEEVGVDTYHHTMFEMLGNWSFGDYFKKEAIDWAWEFLTDVLRLDKDRLYVTIFEGDANDGTLRDQEAYDFWRVHVSEDRIINGNKKDNFWEMGEVGPCGPCSEIHIDIRNEEDRRKLDGKSLVNEDHPQVVEIWNLVFMQFNRMKDGSLKDLKERHVDTGMGLERLVMAMQSVYSNYDTDLFTDSIKALETDCGVKYEQKDSKKDVAFRVIADHVRAVAFSICDGQLPSNNGAGYVIRRILRRAVRYGYSFLNYDDAFIYKLVDVLIKNLGGHFKELEKQRDIITKVIKEEEDGFLRTLAKGIQRFNAHEIKQGQVDGAFAFELYDTYGFPIDLTELLASEKDATVDMDSFKNHLEHQKKRSRKATTLDTGDWEVVSKGQTEFYGYDSLNESAKVLQFRSAKIKDKDIFQIVFDKTPFYAEGGGQVGDKGVIIDSEGNKVKVKNTKKENGLILHFTEEALNDWGADYQLKVARSMRLETQKNHSATHLLHHALRSILGDHVEQKGSLVNDQYLRFDFSHFQKVSEEELKEVAKRVNGSISKGDTAQIDITDIDEAKSRGAMALFGEKYEDKVRVVQFGDSIELCGGCHVKNTSEIGRFIIKSEGSVAAGVRRIEAITGVKADEFINKKLDLLDKVEGLMGNPKDLVKALEKTVSEHKKLEKEVSQLINEKAISVKKNLLNSATKVNGFDFIAQRIELGSMDAIKNIAFQLKGELPNLFMVLAAEVNGKPNITVVVSEELGKSSGLHAGTIVKELAKEIRGGGGGQPFYATAGGSDISGIDNVVSKAKEYIA